jgi:hypothetical protein
MLECALVLLDKVAATSGLAACGDVVQLGRGLSALVNANDDDDGIIVGNWSGKARRRRRTPPTRSCAIKWAIP